MTIKFGFPFGLNKENFPRQRLQILSKHEFAKNDGVITVGFIAWCRFWL